MTEAATKATHYEARDLAAMATAKNYNRWIFDCFAPYLQGRVCEVGAGMGRLSQRILREPAVDSLTVCEPSPHLFAVLENTLGDNPRAELRRSIFADAVAAGCSFDTVIYDNVLEHIEDDAGEIACVASALRPGGHLLILVPALQFLFSDFDANMGHYRRYHKQPLGELLANAGLETVELRHMDILGIVPWFVSMVVLKGVLKPGPVSVYDRIGVPLARTLERCFAPPLGKNLLAIARKPGP